MDPSCLNHVLTPAEERQFAARGYIVLDQMLPPEMVAALTAVSDRIDAEERQKRGVGPQDRLTIRDIVWRDELFLELVDWPRALPTPAWPRAIPPPPPWRIATWCSRWRSASMAKPWPPAGIAWPSFGGDNRHQ